MAEVPSGTAGLQTKKKPRRGMYVLPSLFTAGNIAAGYYAMVQSIQGANMVNDAVGASAAFDHAAIAILFAAVFDDQ